MRTQTPKKVKNAQGQEVWGKGSCAYCAYRPRADKKVAATDQWMYGYGEGAHNPFRCPCFRRWLAQGGDVDGGDIHEKNVRSLMRCVKPKS